MKLPRLFPRQAAAVIGAALFFPHVSDAVFVQVWQAGIDNGTNTEFAQEGGSSNAAPGSATIKDDDWYFAGTYPLPIGVLATDEPNANFERALTLGDPTDRIHFNLAPDLIAPSYEFRLIIDTVSNNSGVPTNPIPFSAFFNGVEIFSGEVNATSQTFTTPVFLASAVGATTGDNVLTLTRSTATGAGWMQFDYIRLESQIPEPSTGIALLLGAAALLGRRRRPAHRAC